MDNIKWENPPVPMHGRRRGEWIDGMVEQLKQNPGEWAKVAEGVTQATRSWADRGCETRTVRSAASKHRKDIYARWPEAAAA